MSTPDSPQRPATVLIIDDNEGNRILLASQLRMEGYELLQAPDGSTGIEIARAHQPDLILLDVMMPDLDGFEVCHRLKTDPLTHIIPIIMVTALREVQYRIRGIEAGANEFLSRPHVREELIVRVRTLIQLKQARAGLEQERNRLQLLYNISRSISAHLDLETMMGEIISQTQKAVGAAKGSILLLDEGGQVTRRIVTRAGRPFETCDEIPADVMARGLAGWLLQHRRGDIINDIQADQRWVTLPDHSGETGSAIGVSLYRADRTVGLLILDHPQPGYFTAEHLALLETVGVQLTAAIENAYLFAEVDEERRKLNALLSRSAEAIINTDEQWRVTLFNHAAEELFGLEADTVVGRVLWQIPELRALIVLLDLPTMHAEAQEVVLNGRILYASMSAIEGVGYLALVRDVTDLRKAEALQLEQERLEKQLVKDTFARYMGPQLVEHVLSHEPSLMARRERRSAVVMYADLRNSTEGIITKVTPDEAIEQLNEFFTRMMEIALANSGTVFELTGDELLVGFNAPFDQPDAALLALKTAVIMQRRFNQLRQTWHENLGTKVGLGIGIDQGEVVVANVGAESRMSFRMVGEVMSRAHRLVEMASDGQVVVSASIYNVLQRQHGEVLQHARFYEVGPIELKGFPQPQTLYLLQTPRTPLGVPTA